MNARYELEVSIFLDRDERKSCILCTRSGILASSNLDRSHGPLGVCYCGHCSCKQMTVTAIAVCSYSSAKVSSHSTKSFSSIHTPAVPFCSHVSDSCVPNGRYNSICKLVVAHPTLLECCHRRPAFPSILRPTSP